MNAPLTEWYDPQPFKLRVSDFEMLDKAGVFDGRYKVELIQGIITVMNAEYRLHGVVKNSLVRRLQAALEGLGSDLEALVEIAVKLDDNSLPQPDALVTHVRLDRRYFAPEDLLIAIEVSDSTIRTDLKRKTALYANAAIPEMWIADLRSAELHQFWQPENGGYAQSRTAFLLGRVESMTVPGLAIDGSGLY